MTAFAVEARAGGVVRFGVRVQPRASRTEVAGVLGGALKVRLQAPPVDGAANAALAGFLADAIGVRRQAVSIVAGAAARTKVIEVAGVDAECVRALATVGATARGGR